jgi:hypothetical protein
VAVERIRQLLARLTAETEAGTLDWRQAREDIFAAHAASESEAEREACLVMHKMVLDAVEQQIQPGDLETFRNARQKDYHFLLAKEARIGRTDRIIEPAVIAAIARREIAAGRMSSANELHLLARAAGARPTPRRRRRTFRAPPDAPVVNVEATMAALAQLAAKSRKPNEPRARLTTGTCLTIIFFVVLCFAMSMALAIVALHGMS